MNRQPFYFGLVPQRCSVCSATSNLLRCGDCKAVDYCGTAHQSTDRLTHKSICKTIKKTQQKLEEEESTLRTKPSDFALPEDVFTNGVGHFWGILDTRDYMRARFAATEALLKANTQVAVEKALGHLKDMLRLSRSDNMGVRDIVPALMLRLGQEQECYDFLKWWAIVAQDGGYDWGDTSLPYLNIRNADPFEPIEVFRRSLSLSHLVILTLLKLRLYLDLDTLAHQEQEFGFSNYSDGDGVLDRPLGKIVKAWVQSSRRPNVSGLAKRMKAQYHELCGMVQDTNPHFWEALVDQQTPAPPTAYSMGSPEEADLVVYQSKDAWEESYDAIVMVEADTSKYVGTYTGSGSGADVRTGTEGNDDRLGASGYRPENLPTMRGTGRVFPSAFNPPTLTPTPAEMFTLNPPGRGDTVRFLHRDSQHTILLYTDGACLNNGQLDPRAGWAVVYGPEKVVSGRLEEKGPFGDEFLATSNRAELRAVIAALRLCDWRVDGYNNIVIATDSSYVVDGATGWAQGWVRNGWKTQVGGDVKNRDLWELLLGEIERWKEQGITVKLWRIPRELNTEADSGAKAAANKMSIENFKDMAIGSPGTPSGQASPHGGILALCLEQEGLFDACFGSLVTGITSKGNLERATTPEAAIHMLSHPAAPSVILVTDGAITRQKKVFECVADALRAGATVILCGCFSNMVTEGEFSRFFARLGLSWARGSYTRETVSLRREAVGAHLANLLPESYSQKALFVKGLERSAAWYTEKQSSTEAAVAFVQVGQGRLGYIGDVNGEESSTTVVMAMCGLLD